MATGRKDPKEMETRTDTIRCGRCHGRHASAAEVRRCYNGETTATYPDAPAAERATPKQVGFLGTLLTRYGASIVSGVQLDLLPKRGPGSASAYIDAMLTYAKTKVQPEGITFANPQTKTTYPDVPAGYYATASATGHNDLDFWRVDLVTEGRWAGRTFVKRVIGGRPSVPVRGASARAALEAIAQDPAAATVLYGQEIGRCGRCNRHLTDELSRSRGIGPDCWAQGYGH